MHENASQQYLPYRSREDAHCEYQSLREELLESQKQRVTLLSGSIGVIGGLFSYIAKDGHLLLSQALVLIALGLPAPFYVYSTRLRERRIAAFIAVYMGRMSFWSTANPHFNIFQRASTAMVGGLAIFNCILLIVSYQLSPASWAGVRVLVPRPSLALMFFVISCAVIVCDLIILYCLTHLPDYSQTFREAHDAVLKRIVDETRSKTSEARDSTLSV